MANTFYQPKNEYGCLLISEVDTKKLLNQEAAEREKQDNNLKEKIENEEAERKAQDKDLEEKIEKEVADRETQDNILKEDISNSHTLKVKIIENSYSTIDQYIEDRLSQATNEQAKAEFNVELKQTIYLLKNKDICDQDGKLLETYEEYICINQERGEDVLPKMTQLGAVDSVLAKTTTPGSTRLAHNIYDTQDWSDYYEKDYKDKVTHEPVKGLAVAPCALEAFKDRDDEIQGEIDEIQDKIGNVNDKVDIIISEIGGSLGDITEEGKIQGSRIDKIESIIGIDSSCECFKDFEAEKCSIICAVQDLKDDCEAHNTTQVEFDNRLTAVEETIEDSIKIDINDFKTIIGSPRDYGKDSSIRGSLAEAWDNITTNADNIATNTKDIATNTKDIATNADNINKIKEGIGDNELNLGFNNITLWKAIENNFIAIDELKNEDIGEDTDVSYGTTIWSAINKIKEGIGDNDSEKTIWGQLKDINDVIGTNTENYKTVWDSIMDNTDSIESNAGKITDNADSINDIKQVIGKKNEKDIDTLWGNITTNTDSINAINTVIGEKNSTNIETLWGKITANTADIEANAAKITDNTDKITDNTTDIEANAASINAINEVIGKKSDIKSKDKDGNIIDDTIWGNINHLYNNYNLTFIVSLNVYADGPTEIAYNTIFEKVFPNEGSGFPYYDIIVNSVKLRDDDKAAANNYNEYYENVFPAIHYYSELSDESGNNDNRKIVLTFADKDSSTSTYSAIMSITVYNNNHSQYKIALN